MKIKSVSIPPGVRLKNQLSQLPDDEVYDSGELSKLIGVGKSTINRMVSELEPAGYAVRLGIRNYYGSKAAIKEFIKHHGKALGITSKQ